MRALTMDEVGVVGGGREDQIRTYGGDGRITDVAIIGYRTPAGQLTYAPTNNYSTPSFNSPSLMYGSFDSMNWCGPVNGGFASQDAQLQCYADWYNAGCPAIQGQTQALETVTVTASRAVSFDNNPFTNIQKAIEFCRNNTDPNTVIVQDASQLHVVQDSPFNAKGIAQAHVSYTDPLWDVYGNITLVKKSDGSVGILNDTFDFDMKPLTLGTALRNALTAIGAAAATDFGNHVCTPFNIEFQGSPIIVSGPKP